MKEYRIAKGWAIFGYLFALLIIGFFGWFLILPFFNCDSSPNAGWKFFPVSIIIIPLTVLGVIDIYKRRLIIYKDSIASFNIFSNNELKFEEIKGYTVNKYYIFLEPNIIGKNRIKISNYIGGYSEILFRLSQTFDDLDEQNAIEEEKEIFNDESIGSTKEIREEKLTKAKKTSKAINWVASITLAWVFFYPIPYQYSMLAAIIIPIIALLAVKLSSGIIRVDEKKGSAHPSVIYAFVFPSLGLMIRTVHDYDIFDYSNVWFIVISITLSFLTILLSKQKEILFKKLQDYFTVISLALFLFAYSFGTVIHVNCYYDDSEAQFFTATVLDKRISSGKSTSYYLKLSTWGQQQKIDEISVGKWLYNRIKVGDEAKIYFRTGKLKIPWFIVTDN